MATELEEHVEASLCAKLDFDEIYDAYFDYVYRTVARLADREDIEDLVQEVFLVVHRRLQGFDSRAKLTTWLFQIAYRVVGAHIRRNKLRRGISALFGIQLTRRVSEPDQLLSIERTEQRLAIERALDALSYKKRAVLILYEVEGWDCARISESLGIPVDTVYSRLHHAHKELKKSFERAQMRGDL
jgi:RNA polymerase sigma-70 factor, ECF subfamily